MWLKSVCSVSWLWVIRPVEVFCDSELVILESSPRLLLLYNQKSPFKVCIELTTLERTLESRHITSEDTMSSLDQSWIRNSSTVLSNMHFRKYFIITNLSHTFYMPRTIWRFYIDYLIKILTSALWVMQEIGAQGNSPKVTLLIKGRAEIWHWVCLTPKLMLLTIHSFIYSSI